MTGTELLWSAYRKHTHIDYIMCDVRLYSLYSTIDYRTLRWTQVWCLPDNLMGVPLLLHMRGIFCPIARLRDPVTSWRTFPA